jgi:RNA polymerase sigma factor (sigma-70 family)
MSAPDGLLTSPTLLRELFVPSNSEVAWHTFVGRYQPLIFSRCCSLGLQHHDAEDVTVTVLAKLATALKDFRYDWEKSFRAWLVRVVTNAVKDFWDYEKRRPAARGSGDSNVAALLVRQETPTALDSLVDELDSRMRADLEIARHIEERVRRKVAPQTWEVFRRTELEGEPAKEVAASLGIDIAKVYVYRNRVKKHLSREAAQLHSGEGADPGGAA